jgi:hypothetical protein
VTPGGAGLGEMLEVLRNLRPSSRELVTKDDRVGCMCGRQVPPHTLEVADSGVVKYLTNVCKGCEAGRKEAAQTASIVCCKCKAVVARMTPHKDKAGFAFRAGRAYHVAECGGCTPGLEQSAIIEKKLHDDRRRK